MSYRRIKAKYDGKIAGLYDLEGTIGKGHYAVVKLARHVFTGEKVAVKVIDKNRLDEVSRAHLFQEVRCMKLVQHPNIVRLYEVIDTQSKLYLILELGDGGDLYDYIMKHDGGLEESMAKTYFHQIVQAIAYCHQLHVVHRDLKPENVVFFDKTGSVKLTDFGFSNKFIPGRKLETSCGSLAYSAPEILLGDSYDPPAVDVWSLGVILYMLVCGKPPFQEANDGETLIKIMDCSYTIPSHVSSICQHLIGKMLVREPSERISLENILIHPWLNEGVSLPPTQKPLVCREALTDDEHSCVVQKIVDGKIASRDEIIHSLERSAYNHITATYFLLAERLLRKRKKLAVEKEPPCSTLSPPSVLTPRPKSPDLLTMNEHRLNLQKLLPDSPSGPPTPVSPISPEQPLAEAGPSPIPPPPLVKRCSLIQEELEEEDEEMDAESSDALLPSKAQRCNGCEQRGSDVSVDKRAEMVRRETDPQMSSLARPVSSGRPLLNIQEDNDAFLQKLVCFSKTDRCHQRRSPTVVKGTSCSSSDTSDTDDAPVYQKPHKEKTRHSVRRNDSGDRSSESEALTQLLSRKDRSRDSSREERSMQEKTRRLSCDMKRRLSIEEKKQSSELIKEKRRNSISGTVKKSVSLILGRAYVVGDNGPDVSFKLNTWNSCSDLSPNVSRVMNTSSLSNRHLADRTILGCILARELRLSRSEFLKESETLGRENRPRSRVIHVRSNDFSCLVDKFSSTVEDDASKTPTAAHSDRGLRQRVKGDTPLKTDINRNALNSLNQSGDHLESGEKPSTAAKTKCCSLV